MRYAVLAAEIENTYGVGVLAANPVTVLWAAQRVADRYGADVAKRELSALNKRRDRMGKMPAYPAFGSELF